MMAVAHYNSLDRFPTWMWIRDDGYTLVLGAPDDSYVFYTPQFPIDRLLAYPLYGLAVLFVDGSSYSACTPWRAGVRSGRSSPSPKRWTRCCAGSRPR